MIKPAMMHTARPAAMPIPTAAPVFIEDVFLWAGFADCVDIADCWTGEEEVGVLVVDVVDDVSDAVRS
jgi:hypothetical protein